MTTPRPTPAALLLAILPATAPLVLVAIAWERSPLVATVIVAIGAVASVVLRRWLPWWGSIASAGPVLVALAYVAATAFSDPVSEALVGASALGAVAWLAVSASDGPTLPVAVRGLLLPALALGIALSVSFLLPVASQSIGIAAVLLVAALALVGWALLRIGPAPTVAPPSL